MAIQLGDDNEEIISEINVTPLVDVMLVLVVVFLVTAPLLTQILPVNLPKTADAASQAPVNSVPIAITTSGQISIEQVMVSSPADLEQRLKQRLQSNADTHFVLHADASVIYSQVAMVLAAAHRAGVTHLSLATLQE